MVHEVNATIAAWFSTFLLNALVKRVKRRIPIRIVRFCPTTAFSSNWECPGGPESNTQRFKPALAALQVGDPTLAEPTVFA
jgi:hypothetical protein